MEVGIAFNAVDILKQLAVLILISVIAGAGWNYSYTLRLARINCLF
jgi:hypothetical protein